MKRIINITPIFLIISILTGCNYLDVVPNDTATLDHAFSNRSVAEKFLRTCYSHLPDPTNIACYPAYYTSRDEFDFTSETRMQVSPAGRIASGLQNSNDPYQNYWSGRQGGDALYVGIRDCNIFLENIGKPQDLSEEERSRWIGEVKFLKAYYHFFLMQLYGPIVLVKENVPISATPEEVRLYREPIDECVDYIVELLDEAIADLPLVLPDPAAEQGRITATIALGIKAKVLAWAASPLFNGNEDYKDWVDNRGVHLVPSTYDISKWEKAAAAIKEAIDSCHAAGFRLYEFNKVAGGAQTFKMNDTLTTLMTIRKAITEDIERNTGMIWSSQETFSSSKAGISVGVLGHMLQTLFPSLYATDQNIMMGYYSASWHMAELFYSNHGVPIDEDKTFDYSGRYDLHRATIGDRHESYIATGQTTINLHFNREPRFYADLGFDRGFYEVATTTTDGGGTFSPYLNLRSGEVVYRQDNIETGYKVKKIIPFECSGSQGQSTRNYFTSYDYRFPLLRLADLYLLYSEALNEIKSQPDQEVYEWIDRVRQKAGLAGVLDSWSDFSSNPTKPTTQSGMREIIRRERLIELAFEGQRFWDIRRWKIADKYWTLPPTRWRLSTNIDETYSKVVYGKERAISFRDYLYPLSASDLRINTNLVQTYGW